MNKYNFETLNDKEFEELIRDLLTREFEVEFQSFKTGKDMGIDLRYSSTVDDNSIIVQVKHYSKSKYPQLKSQLKNKELKKVKRLNPKRYIIATSLELNPQQTKEIKEIFEPYIKSINDIFWNQRVNSLLSKYKDVERKHYKLWLSSTEVLSTILNNGAYLKSYFLKKDIKKKMCLYVKTKFHDEAKQILEKEKVLLVSGSPGVGKTTLAQMLILDYINNGFEPLVIEDKISEAEDIISLDDKKKQIIYFDDFLGSNIYDLLNPRNGDHALSKFIGRIKYSANKVLILTTRTVILNQAIQNYEKLKYDRLHKNNNFEIRIQNYTLLEKAQILYNHIYFSDIDKQYRDKLFEAQNYLKVISHVNYNPRLIEFFTSKAHLSGLASDSYIQFLKKNLNKPEEIWRHSFENQIDREERFLLFALLSLKGNTKKEILENAFNERLRYEIKEYNHILKDDGFNRSLKTLEKGYIKITMVDSSKTIKISFINPSIGDFLLNQIEISNSDRKRLFQSIIYLDQITNIFHPTLKDHVKLNNQERVLLYNSLIDKEELLTSQGSFFYHEYLKLLLQYFHGISKTKDIIRIFKKIDFSNINIDNRFAYIYILSNVYNIKEAIDVIFKNWKEIILDLYKTAMNGNDFEDVYSLFELYQKSYTEFLKNEFNQSVIRSSIVEILSDEIDQKIKSDSYNYDYEAKEEYVQVDYNEYYTETVGFDLLDDVDELIRDELDEYLCLPFLCNGLEISVDCLSIDSSYLKQELEELYFENRVDRHVDKYIYNRAERASNVSDMDEIKSLFEKND